MNDVFSEIQTNATRYFFSSYKTLAEDIKKYDYALVYKLDRVVVEKTSELSDSILDDDLLELRAFNKDEELHIVKTEDGFVGRVRTDGTGEKTEYLDEAHLIWGEPKDRKDGKTYMLEDRGTQLWLPIDVPDGERAFVTVRNYLSNDKDIFEFNDFRMVEFFHNKAESYENKQRKEG